ncbi:hypothetical protein Srot_0888 [Segniliparus rotundus DSM 44985]|uniref:Uncharacterized protein n=1 Tax=Segniliparus rotundus (strain ATCC BAA-972 / CDC 1076 / CIP 108378 / DSM 44985 / JCM 13578) TaxID=640132 RepID=D6ZE85_SEGRD|nr:hypothetical protein Srot_0888 [Segniliparus rotundus DSM 44985]
MGYVAALYQFHPGKVLYQIKVGRLPALAVIGGNGRLTAYAIKLADAEHLWGTAPKHFPSDNAKNAA